MGESSPDLSLRLRRGSSDSRDSFYMDFAQGIDSDIEEVARPADNNLDDNHLNDNGDMMEDGFPPLDDICTTIPEEASEELREEEEEEAAAAAAASTGPTNHGGILLKDTFDFSTISNDIRKIKKNNEICRGKMADIFED
ncbi:hypothetical protein PV327_003165 [Microctonus hyperodae]|uniref:Uncharacterized protein n=1 Tax=Microctonus hyperodae TaxID=165561 RepID=A0AA39G3S5_MICHY|nr:hypothetical protein PV327_003165 [Microctonus hyperodae]